MASPDQVQPADRLAAVDQKEEARRIPAGAVSPTHVTDDDIFIQFNARFRPVPNPPDEDPEETSNVEPTSPEAMAERAQEEAEGQARRAQARAQAQAQQAYPAAAAAAPPTAQ